MEPKDSPYFYGNRECPPTMLILKHHSTPVITQELPWDIGLWELFESFVSACSGIGFGDRTKIMERLRDDLVEEVPFPEDNNE